MLPCLAIVNSAIMNVRVHVSLLLKKNKRKRLTGNKFDHLWGLGNEMEEMERGQDLSEYNFYVVSNFEPC